MKKKDDNLTVSLSYAGGNRYINASVAGPDPVGTVPQYYWLSWIRIWIRILLALLDPDPHLAALKLMILSNFF